MKKVLSLVLSFLLILSLTPLVSAKVNYEEEQTENSIAAVYDGQGNLEGYLASVDDIAEIDTVDFEVVLLKDITVEIQGSRFSSYGLMASCNLNLNGHSVTVTGTVTQGIIITGVMVTGDISNGSILLNFTVNNGDLDGSQAICGLFAADSSTISDVEIIYSGDSNDESIDGIAFGSYTSANPDTERKNTVKNVVVDVPGSAISETNLDTPASTMEIVSGSFKNLGTPSESGSITVSGSKTTIPGVNGSEDEDSDVTVYTSGSTTAVIVKDGNAYLYDTLQEAVDAAAKRSSTSGEGDEPQVTISLLKTPEGEDQKITLPDELKDIGVTINSLPDGEDTNDYLEGVSISTESGEKVVVEGDGKLNITEVTSLSVSPASLTLYSNTTPNTATLTATVTPADAAAVTWTSSDTSVATVENGIVKAVGNGTANITATAGGMTATCTVTVRTYTPPVITDPTYPPEITESENGSVTTSPARPEQGDKVTITAEPDEGYKVDTVIVVDEDGDRVTVTSAGDGKYIFTQPKGEVTITVTFVWDNPFSDVPMDAWYTDAIEYVEVHGLMDGLPGGLFAPNKELTRAEAVQILYNLEGQPTVTGDSTFTDLTDDWYVNAITWAEINGVVDGYGDGTFQPNDTVTREEFAQMMYNYTAFKGLDTSATADLVSKFPDGNEVGAWAETAMEWANGNELINGHDDGTLDPQGIAIRAQAASILMRFDLNLVKAD